MYSKILLLTVGLFCLIAGAFASCNCGLGVGYDPCRTGPTPGGPDGPGGPGCVPLVVRPAPLPKIDISILTKPRIVYKRIEGIAPLKPVGDLCTCGQTIVKPAVVPKPACRFCSHSSSSHLNSQQQLTAAIAAQGGWNGGSLQASGVGCGGSIQVQTGGYINELPVVGPYPYLPVGGSPAPADAVSLALALKKQKQTAITEDRLAFGFAKLPKEEVQVILKKKVIPEEDFYKVNGDILELQKTVSGPVKTVDEEAEEDLLINEEIPEEEIAVYAPEIKQLSLGEIGYGPANIKPAKFVSITNPSGPSVLPTEFIGSDSPNAPGLLGGPRCLDGYQPGKVIIKDAPPVASWAGGPLIPAPACDSGESLGPKPYPLPSPYYIGAASAASAQSVASSSSNYFYHS